MSLRRPPLRRAVGPLLAALAIGTVPGSASAATTVGEAFPPAMFCGGNFTRFQANAPGGQFAVPYNGVITAWSFHGSMTGPFELTFKVGRVVDAAQVLVVGESAVEAPVPSQLATFPTRIPVKAGDLIGTYQPTSALCQRTATGYRIYSVGGEVDAGETSVFGVLNDLQSDLSATLEHDADDDGFGDETQDACPSDASTQGDCAGPETTITNGPKSRTKRKAATFEFAGTDPRALAGFQCSLDAAAFAACSSPHGIKVKPGEHTFSVRAVDAAGNVDGTPATQVWKVKKKKKKK